MRLTVYEQGAVGLRATEDANLGCVSHLHAESLLSMCGRIGARFVSWDNPTTLRLHQFVGAVRSGDLELEILPKINAVAGALPVRRTLLRMLAVAENLDLKDSEAIAYWDASEPTIATLARLYCGRLIEAVRRGLRQEYVLFEEDLPRVRGKVRWAAQAKLNATHRVEFCCSFDERSEDNAFNRTLKAGLRRAEIILEGREDTATLTELRHVFDGVLDTRPTREELDRVRTDRLNRHLDPLLTLAKLLLGKRNPDVGRGEGGEHRSYALLWDMNDLFERYIGRLVQRMLGSNRVVLQDSSTYLAFEPSNGRSAFLLNPDILVSAGGKPVVIADTKWKRLKGADKTLGISEHDAYQVLAYAQRFCVNLAVLIYPHGPSLGPPGHQRDFIVQAGGQPPVVLRVITVDLGRPDDVAAQVLAGLSVSAAAVA